MQAAADASQLLDVQAELAALRATHAAMSESQHELASRLQVRKAEFSLLFCLCLGSMLSSGLGQGATKARDILCTKKKCC